MENGVFTIPLCADLVAAEPDAPRGSAPGSSVRTERTDTAAERARVSLDFVAGPENRLPAVAIESLLRERPSPFNPLVIVGSPGTGKTHLARGLTECWAARHALPSDSVAYFNASDFAHELKTAIDSNATPEFQRRVRSVSLLVIEGLTQLQSRRVAQQELVHSLDAVIDGGGQVVVTSNTAPQRILGLSPDLRSRLSAGLTVSLMAPAAATRLAIVQRLAELRSIPIIPSAMRALADGLNGTASELLGALLELDMRSRLVLNGDTAEQHQASPLAGDRNALSEHSDISACRRIAPRTIDARAVRQWLAERRMRLQPSLRTIAKLAAKYFGLRVAELLSPSRRRAVVQARGIAMYLGRQLTAKSLEQLGKHFGGRDHTTVLHSYRSIEGRMQSDPAMRRAVSDIRKAVAHA